MKVLTLATAVLLATAMATPASAQLLQYTLTGTDFSGAPEYASFQIDAHPTILPNNYALGEGFRVKLVPGTFHYDVGPQYLSDLQDVAFVSDSGGGGFFTLFPTDTTGAMGTIINIAGTQLYTGPESSPTLVAGNFTVFDSFDGAPLSLSITAVPEPLSWTMMILGAGAVGAAMRRRRTVTTRIAYAA